VKAANILLNDQGEVKIADFGVSEKIEKVSQFEMAGSPLWLYFLFSSLSFLICYFL